MARGWMILVIGGLLGASLGWAFSRDPDRFEAVATLQLTPPPADSSGIFTIAGTRTLLSSQTIAAAIVDEFGLAEPPHRLSAQSFLSEAYTIEEVPTTYLLRQKVRLLQPELAARVATRLAERGIEQANRLWADSASSRVTQLEIHVEHARATLSDAEQRMLTYRERAGLDLLKQEIDGLLSRRGTPGRRTIADLYSRELELVRLETEVEAKRRVFIDLTARHEQARIELGSVLSPLRLIDAPVVPDQPLASGRRRTVAVGLLAGLILGMCLVVARDWRQQAELLSVQGHQPPGSTASTEVPPTHDERARVP